MLYDKVPTAMEVKATLSRFLIHGNKTADGFTEIAGRLTNYDRWFCEELEAVKGIYETMSPEPTGKIVVNKFEKYTCSSTEVYIFPDGSKIAIKTTKDVQCLAYDKEGHGINIYQNEKMFIQIM